MIVSCLGLGASLAGAVRYGLLNEVAAEESYLLGGSVLNMSVGAMQICGFAAKGIFVTALSPRGTLLVGAGLYATGATMAAVTLILAPGLHPAVPDRNAGARAERPGRVKHSERGNL